MVPTCIQERATCPGKQEVLRCCPCTTYTLMIRSLFLVNAPLPCPAGSRAAWPGTHAAAGTAGALPASPWPSGEAGQSHPLGPKPTFRASNNPPPTHLSAQQSNHPAMAAQRPGRARLLGLATLKISFHFRVAPLSDP